jgi:DNA transposition AAA+ family ATPase
MPLYWTAQNTSARTFMETNDMKRKENFINDKRRVSYLASVYYRINHGKSVLIEGGYGAGKTRFLQLIQPKKLHPVWVESLFNVHVMLASILEQLNYEATANYRRSPKYLKLICNLSNFFIIIDEATDLDRRIWPYLKRIIDAGVPVVLAGLPKVRTYLTSEHPDILSRLKTLLLYPIEVEDFILEYKDFEAEAVEQIYAATKGDMRKFEEVSIDCWQKAKELNHSFVDVNLVLSYLAENPVI